MILKRMTICALILSTFILVTGAGEKRDSMKEIHKLWSENQPRRAFEVIIDAAAAGDDLDVKELIELTGIRTVAKVLDGDRDEKAIFVNSSHVILCKPDRSMRICDIETGLSFSISPEVLLVQDKLGVVVNDSKYIYFLRSKDEQLTLFEYCLRGHLSRPLGNLHREEITPRYDPELFQLQFVDKLGISLKTYDLDQRRVFPENHRINARDTHSQITSDLKKEGRDVLISFNKKVFEIPFSGIEFPTSAENPDLLFNPQDMNAVIIKSDWYPNLYILFDLQKERAMKLFLPVCVDPSYDSWYFDSGILYIWKSRCDGFGLYKVNFEEKITGDDLGRLIKEYNLASGKELRSENQPA